MSQKVNIVKVTYVGTPFYLGEDKQNNSMYTRNAERIMEYLCDGWRFTYNCYRGGREKWDYKRDENGDKVLVDGKTEWVMVGRYSKRGPHFLLPPATSKTIVKDGKEKVVESVPCIPQDSLRETYSFLKSMPPEVGSSSFIRLWENTDWNTAKKAAKTVREKGGRYVMPGLKMRKNGLAMKIQPKDMFKSYRQLNAKFGEVTIKGTHPKDKAKEGPLRWELKIKVALTQPIRIEKKGQSMTINWSKRTLSFVNNPLPVTRGEVKPIVGLDRGVTISVATSEGMVYTIPKEDIDRTKVLQRKLSRKVKGSNGFKRAKAELNKSRAKEARKRENWIHEVSKKLVQNYDTIVLEALDTKKMTKSGRKKSKKSLNRNILQSNWYKLQSTLEYKAKAVGGKVVTVDPAYTSQACTECHYVHKDNRPNQSTFKCVKCGHSDNADMNAAKNIYKKFTGELVTPVRNK